MSEECSFLLRRMEARDIAAVVSVDRAVFEDPWPESAYVQELYFNPNARYFVLSLNDPGQLSERRESRALRTKRLVGFVGMRVERDKGHISTLAVRPEWRGRKFGELLLLRALIQAMQDGAQTVTLEVRISNSVAQSLYRKYGFQVASRLLGYYFNGEDAYLMRAGPFTDTYRDSLSCDWDELSQALHIVIR